MNARTLARPLRSLVAGAAGLLVVAGAVFGGSAAMASPADDIIGGTVVGGNSGPSYYREAGSLGKTTCTSSDNSVYTTVSATARQYSGSQLFNVRVLARDVTGGRIGAWSQYVNQQRWVYETYAAGLPQQYTIATSKFTGIPGHSYQVYAEVFAWNGSSWVNVTRSVIHYSTFGAYERNVYGQLIQQQQGAGSSSCLVL